MFLGKIPLKIYFKKKKVGKKKKKPTTPFPRTTPWKKEKKKRNSTLKFRNNQTSPISHVNQETTPH
jgi:hypothetical protein